MNSVVTIVDYGSGNLLSVTRALEHCGANVVVSHDPAEVQAAERLVVPGVGAFADGMNGLRERALVDPIRRFAASGRPLLGICLGMQMLATASEEFGEHEGLDLVPGRVVRLPNMTLDGLPQKTPHVGWADLWPAEGIDWKGSLFDDTPPGTSVYLVHSYAVLPDNPAHRLADCFYGGHRIAASIRNGNVVGCQFHPEKSAAAGLRILRGFLAETVSRLADDHGA